MIDRQLGTEDVVAGHGGIGAKLDAGRLVVRTFNYDRTYEKDIVLLRVAKQCQGISSVAVATRIEGTHYAPAIAQI